jgi:hypothetical protein
LKIDDKILKLIDSYIEVSIIFWSEDDPDIDITTFNAETIEWMKNEWAVLDKMDSIKQEVLRKIEGDKLLFNKYLGLGSCLRTEDYEQAEVFKKEILNYGKES